MIFFSCSNGTKEISFTGTTMGTVYTIKIRVEGAHTISADGIKTKVDDALSDLNQQVSTYIPTSEISAFNRLPAGQWYTISDDFHIIVQQALKVYAVSGGAFDITVHPLVRLWGFGNDGSRWEPPTEPDIRLAMAALGSQHIKLSGKKIQKDIDGLEIDLSAIAKGYGVDMISRLLKHLGYKNFMIEIGGEVRCNTENTDSSWKIGIEIPTDTPANDQGFAGIVRLGSESMATSGNYANYFIYEGKRYSHTMNPKTGRPVDHRLASTTVITSICMMADALATAVMVLGVDEGLKLVESLDEVECFLIEVNDDGSTTSFSSSGFSKFME